MGLIDDRVFESDPERLVSLPVKTVGCHYGRLGRGGEIISSGEAKVAAGVVPVIGIGLGLVPVMVPYHRFAIGIEKELVGVEPVAWPLRDPGSVKGVTVELSRFYSGNEEVPNIAGLIHHTVESKAISGVCRV